MTFSAQSGLAMSHGLAKLSGPVGPEQWPAAYGLGIFVQLGPETAGLFLNIRAGGVNVIDFEMGVDLIVFSQLSELDVKRARRIKRNEAMQHPETGDPMILVTYPGNIGFIPLGARRLDGSPHPHAGTGFSISRDIAFPADMSARRHQEIKAPWNCLALQQYRYDGTHFETASVHRFDASELLDGWTEWSAGLSTAIPDCDDLLMPFFGASAAGETPPCPFLARWEMGADGWLPREVYPIEDAAGCREPSLVRDSDGSLLLTARHGWPPNPENPACLRVWRSINGVDWTRCVDLAGVRSGGPLSIGRSATGRPFIIGNGPNEGRHSRASVSLWPLNDERNGITQDTVEFDADERCGPAPVFAWNVDHSIPAVVQLADGKQHCLVAMRVCETTEVVRDTLPTPATGCYIESIGEF